MRASSRHNALAWVSVSAVLLGLLFLLSPLLGWHLSHWGWPIWLAGAAVGLAGWRLGIELRELALAGALVNILLMILLVGVFYPAAVRFLTRGQWRAYSGDGVLTDHGRYADGARYIVDLGPIERTESRFRLAGLPPTHFTLGLGLAGPTEEANCNHDSVNPLVRLRMWREDGQLVIDESGSLDQWHSSFRFRERKGASFVGCRDVFFRKTGKSEKVALPNGEPFWREVGIRSDQGWGTSFVARESAVYELEMKTSWVGFEPYELRLQARAD